MQELWLDGQRVEPNGVISWGELLESLETRHLVEGRIISAVSFNGEDVSEFRGAGIEQTQVANINRVDVMSADITDYVRELVSESTSHLDGIVQVLNDATSLYKREMETDAAARLHAALTGLDTLMRLVQTVTTLAGWDIQEFDVGDERASEGLDRLTEVLEGVVHHQEQGDTGKLACAIEERLIPGLDLWGAIIQEIQTRLTPRSSPEA